MGINIQPSGFIRLPAVPRPQLLGRGVLSVGPNVPVPPMVGDLWWRTDPDGALYLYYDDGSSAQWVTASPGVGLLSGTPPAWIQFPDTPTLNQTFTATNGITYTWDGTVWIGTSALWTLGLAQLDGTTVPVLVSPNGIMLPAGQSLFLQPGVLQPGVGGPPWIANGATGNPWLVLGTNGYVGIGGPTTLGTNPVEALDVYGGIRLGVAKDTNPVTLPGTLQYFGGQLEVYTPSGWTNVVTSPATGGPAPPTTFPGPIIIDGAGATAPVAGEIIWNGTNFQGFDGSVWRNLDVPWGPISSGDLAGSSYPNPVIAGGAVTDAKIANVSWAKVTGAPAFVATPIPAGSFAPGSIHGADLYPAASIQNAQGIGGVNVSPTPGVETIIAETSWTTRGSLFLAFGVVNGYAFTQIQGTGTILTRLRLGTGPAGTVLPGTPIASTSQTIGVSGFGVVGGTQTVQFPLSMTVATVNGLQSGTQRLQLTVTVTAGGAGLAVVTQGSSLVIWEGA